MEPIIFPTLTTPASCGVADSPAPLTRLDGSTLTAPAPDAQLYTAGMIGLAVTDSIDLTVNMVTRVHYAPRRWKNYLPYSHPITTR
ncbi:hypothetical protein [Neolewinella litorea]|uniref:hypothetical protein n=1 Tax=Neolewinella litorea TaxID=2562452 RepID=UPI001455ED84|nr:hypothetical protein [Neolewinella litorea]